MAGKQLQMEQRMQYRQLGKSELKVSELALGSWLTYGVGVDNNRAAACINQAFDSGINFIDTANVYGRGAAESLLGELLAGRPRDSYVLATKVYFPMSKSDRGLSAEQIRKQLDNSLQRLRTDYVDLFQCHRYDHDTPLEETMAALTQAVDSGKVRYIGFSEWPADKIRLAMEMNDVAHFVSSQPHYSMLGRWPEAAVIPACREYGIKQIVFSPLAQGVLTGKYQPGQPPPDHSRGSDNRVNQFMGDWLQDEVLVAVASLEPLAAEAGLSLAQLALAWLLQNDNVAATIIGASRPEQIIDNAGASGIKLDPALMQAIDDRLQAVIRR